MEIIGKIKKIFDTKVVSDKFKKREFVLTIDLNTPYPQDIIFQVVNDKTILLDNLKPNDEVKVFFSIRGKEYINANNEIKYFVTLDAFRIDKFVKLDNHPIDNFKPNQPIQNTNINTEQTEYNNFNDYNIEKNELENNSLDEEVEDLPF